MEGYVRAHRASLALGALPPRARRHHSSRLCVHRLPGQATIMGAMRRTRHLLVVIGLALAVLAAALYLFRIPLANHLLAVYLQEAGIPGQASFTALGPSGATLESVSLEEFAAEGIEVGWDIYRQDGLVPTSVTIHEPSLTLDLTAGKSPFQATRAAIDGLGRGDGGTTIAVPLINVVDGRARLVAEQGEIGATFSMSSEHAPDGLVTVRGRAEAAGLGFDGKIDVQGAMQGRQFVRLLADFRGGYPESGDSLAVGARVSFADRGPELHVDAEGRLSTGPLARLGLVPPEAGGRLAFTLSSLSAWPPSAADGLAWPGDLPARLTAELDLQAEGLVWAPELDGGQLDLNGELTWDGTTGIARLRPTRPVSLKTEQLNRSLLPPAVNRVLAPGFLENLSLSIETPVVEIQTTREPLAASRLSVGEFEMRLATGLGDQASARGRIAVRLADGVSGEVEAGTEFSMPRSIEGLSPVDGSLRLSLESVGPRVTVRVDDPLRVSMVPRKSVLPGFLDFLSGESVRLEAARRDDQTGPVLELRRAEGGLDFSQSGVWSAKSRRSGTVRFGGIVTGRQRPDSLDVDIHADRLEGDDIRTPLANVDGLVAGGNGQVRFEDGAFAVAGQVDFEPMELVTGARAISLGRGRADFSLRPDRSARLDLELAELGDRDLAVSLRDSRFSARRSVEDVTRLVLAQATLHDLWLPRRFPTSAVTGEGRWAGQQFSGVARVSPVVMPAAALQADFAYDLEDKRGEAEFATSGLNFSRDLQPDALWARLNMLKDVRGGLEIQGSLRFDSDGLIDSRGRADLSLDGFESGGVRISGLSMPLDLSSLWPVESHPGQRLTVARIEDGAVLTDVDVEYRLAPKPTGQPVLQVAGATMQLLGGTMRVGAATYDPQGDLQTAIVEAEGLDLVSILSMITTEGLGGEGRLKGRFPVRTEGGVLVVEDARLEAESPGILRFRSPEAAQTLSGAGDHLNLLLDALQNFHYSSLTLTADKPVAGDMVILLSLAGNNPDVLEGYPFNINLRLETDAAPLLSTLRQGSNLFDEIVRRVWQSDSAIR